MSLRFGLSIRLGGVRTGKIFDGLMGFYILCLKTFSNYG